MTKLANQVQAENLDKTADKINGTSEKMKKYTFDFIQDNNQTREKFRKSFKDSLSKENLSKN